MRWTHRQIVGSFEVVSAGGLACGPKIARNDRTLNLIADLDSACHNYQKSREACRFEAYFKSQSIIELFVHLSAQIWYQIVVFRLELAGASSCRREALMLAQRETKFVTAIFLIRIVHEN